MSEESTPARQIVEALGTAWTTFGLYPNPEEQDAFSRSLEAVRGAAVGSFQLGVGPGHFTVAGETIETDREGPERLARQCYLHEIETVRIGPSLPASDLLTLFRILSQDEQHIRSVGGVDMVLKRDGAGSISTVQKPILKEASAPIERPDEVQEVIDQPDAATFAAQLLREARAGSLPEMFISRYLGVLGAVAEDDVTGREEVVRSFVEAFFHFDEPQQVEVFRELLNRRQDASIRMFIDQFAGHELARMAPRLDPSALGMLMEYAQVSTDQADKRPDELLALLGSPEALDSARMTVAARIQERIGDVAEAAEAVGTSFDSIRGQMPDSRRLFFDALEAFRAILHVENREPRFSRLIRIWTGKMSAAIRRGEIRRAELWLHAGLDNPTYPPERRSDVLAAVELLAASDSSRMVVEAGVAGEGERAYRLLHGLGAPAVNALVDMLSEEQDAGRRRAMLEGLTQAAQANPLPILSRLEGAPWYLARNLAGPLGRSGHPEVGPELGKLLDHNDHRVRLEATRSLVTLLGEDSVPYLEKALADESRAVRHAALGLLTARRSEASQAALARALERDALEPSEKERIIESFGPELTAEAYAALARLARQRVALSGSARSLRATAQEALRKAEG